MPYRIKSRPSKKQVELETKKIIEKLKGLDKYFDAISSVLEGFDGRLRTLEERAGIEYHESGETIENRKEEGQESGTPGRVETDGTDRTDQGNRGEGDGGGSAVGSQEGESGAGERGTPRVDEGSPGC